APVAWLKARVAGSYRIANGLIRLDDSRTHYVNLDQIRILGLEAVVEVAPRGWLGGGGSGDFGGGRSPPPGPAVPFPFPPPPRGGGGGVCPRRAAPGGGGPRGAAPGGRPPP